MNARIPLSDNPVPRDRTTRPESPREPIAQPPRHLHRERDFGIGYGNSSGYGSELHYVDGHVDPIFRCA